MGIISNWLYEHTGGLIGQKIPAKQDPANPSSTTTPSNGDQSTDPAANSSAAPNAPKPDDPADKDNENPFLKTLKMIMAFFQNIIKALEDWGHKDYGAVIGDIFNALTGKSDTKNETSSSGNSPSVIHRVENWVANKAAPAASIGVVRDAALRGGLTSDDAADLCAIVQGESAWDREARNSKSTAGGWWQFLDASARAMGIRDKFDPIDSSNGAVRYYKEIRQYLADHVYHGDISQVKRADIKLGWAYGESGAANLLNGDPNASAADALRKAGTSNAESAIGGNLTDAFKAANPDWAKMTKAQLVSEVETNFDKQRAGFLAIPANAAALNLAPPAPGAPAPKSEVVAEAAAPQTPAQPRPAQAERASRDYRGLHIAVTPEETVALNNDPSSKVTSIDAGRKGVVVKPEESQQHKRG